MPGFSSDEIQTAVDRFLLRVVSVPKKPTTGVRDIVASRNLVFDLLTTVLLLRSDSYFYVIWLAKNRLRGLVAAQIDDLDLVNSWAAGVSRPSKRIRSVAELVNAQAALLDLNAGLGQRSVGIRGSIGPAVDRFRRSVSKFIDDELTQNVVNSGEITETAEELRGRIAQAWSGVTDRHDVITGLLGNVETALAALGRIRLPESSIRGIVGRIQSRLVEVQTQMSGSEAVAQSREAMLELLVMRTLLAKAAGFRNPLQVLAPLPGDSSTMSLVDGSGAPGSIRGGVSAPFNYAAGTILGLSVSGGFTPVALPGDSRAGVHSEVLTFPSGPGGGASLAVAVDYGGLIAISPSASYASGPAAASGLNTDFAGSVLVSWDAAASQLVFQSPNPDDTSHLRFNGSTAARQQSLEWLFGAVAPEAAGVAVMITDVIDAVSMTTSGVDTASVFTRLAGFRGVCTALLGEEAAVWDRRDIGTDLICDGSNIVRSLTKNFQRLGVTTNMGIVITAPPASAGNYVITAMNGGELTLSSPVAVGTATYYIGPQYDDIPVGARVRVIGSVRDNSGLYRVTAHDFARIEVTPDLRAEDSSLVVVVFTEFLDLASHGLMSTDGIGTLVPSLGATALGLAITADETRAGLTALVGEVDLLTRGVRSGDVIELTSPAAVEYTRTIDTVDTLRLVLTQGVAAETGNWTYEISSSRYAAFVELQAGADTYDATTYASSGFKDLDPIISRLIIGARYSSAFQTALTTYRLDLVALQQALDGYVVPQEVSIDAVVQTMREQGMDRAVDLLLTLEIETFFSMPADGVSYSTNMVRQAATTTREVAPMSKHPRGDRIGVELEPVSQRREPYDPMRRP